VQTDIHSDIIEQCKQGSARAQYRLYNQYARAMYNLCLRMMNTQEEAEDMLQEAFSLAFARLHSFRYESTFGAWLKRIVVNHCINEINRRKVELNFFDDMHYFEGEDKNDNELEYEDMLNVQNIKKAMEQLPKGSRMIFSLYLLEGYDHVEISEILKISESNSKSQYMRARRKVKEILMNMQSQEV
jgi:RNA polymerase sigma factor (sigma-70 family)